MRQLRLLREPVFGDGASNMAVDCAILDAVSRSAQPPTLRLYGWDPFCLSLGYGQRIRDVDLPQLSAKGWHLVRRPTGGKAILHGDELTYSLCLPLDHPLAAGGVVGSYRQIGGAILHALRHLGLPVRSEQQAASHHNLETGPVCFEVSSHYEITLDGRKLVGSAQMRRKAAILQHGTIPLFGDVARICDVLRFDSPQEREQQKLRVRQRALALAQVMEAAPTWELVANALEYGFGQEHGLELCQAELTGQELRQRDALLEERFANPAWTRKR